MSGSAKFASAPTVVAVFNAIGAAQRFRYFTGAVEVTGSAVAVCADTGAVQRAPLLAATMIRAVATHVLIVGGSALPALVLLAAIVAIAWARREQLAPRAE